MWQAAQEEQADAGHHGSSNNSGRNPHMVVSSSSKSSSSSSSPSPFTSSTVPQTPGRTMEEVWKDITLGGTATPILDSGGHRSPYYHHPPAAAAAAAAAACHSSIPNADLPHLRGMILQDFLARPFRGKAAAVPAASVQPAGDRGPHGDTRLPGPRLDQAPRRRSSPATVLSLNSGADFQYMDAAPPGRPLPPAGFPNARNQSHGQPRHGTHIQRQSPPSSPFSVSLGSPFPGIFPFCTNKKRAPELQQQQQQLDSSDGAGGDRRNKRMIKNRESAARSRARKQAYTNELELEVNHLTEENQKLTRQHDELRAQMAAQLSRKKTLQRTSTAPF